MNIKIDINIDDNRKYAALAYLVDRDKFLADIADLRKRIKNLIIPYEFPTFKYDRANELVAYFKNGQFTITDTILSLEEFAIENGLVNLYALDNTLGVILLFARSLASKYGKQRVYLPIMLSSIVGHSIQEYDFSSTYFYEITPESIKHDFEELEENMATIVVNSESTQDEVIRIFNHIQKYYFKVKKLTPKDGLANIYDTPNSTKLPDEAQFIKRHREWYWQWKQEKTKGKGAYNRILNLWNETNPQECIYDVNIVEQAVSRYRSRLKADI